MLQFTGSQRAGCDSATEQQKQKLPKGWGRTSFILVGPELPSPTIHVTDTSQILSGRTDEGIKAGAPPKASNSASNLIHPAPKPSAHLLLVFFFFFNILTTLALEVG